MWRRWRRGLLRGSLRKQLTITLLGGIALTALSVPAITFFLTKSELQRYFRSQAIAATEAAARQSVYLILGGSQPEATRVIKSILNRPDIEYAALVDAVDGRNMATVGTKPVPLPENFGRAPSVQSVSLIEETTDYWHIAAPLIPASRVVSFGEREAIQSMPPVGYLHVVFAKKDLGKLVSLVGLVCGISSVFIAGIVLWWGTTRLRALTVPLDTLAHVVKHATLDGARASTEGPAEVSTIATVFNALMDRVAEYTNELEDKVARRTAALQSASDAAQQAERYKSALLAASTHEMKMPLHLIELSVRASLQELEFMGSEAEPVREAQRTILRASGELLSRILKLLAAARSAGTVHEVNMNAFAVKPFLDDLRERMEPLARAQKNLLICESNGLSDIMTDREKLYEIACELLMNACKFTQDGEVRFEITASAHDVIMTIVDNGCGIPVADHATIWLEFRQLRGSVSPTYPGQGLGLSMVRRLVDVLHGNIHLDSDTGTGTRIVVTIPSGQATSAVDAPSQRA